jgi:hypothetical protein
MGMRRGALPSRATSDHLLQAGGLLTLTQNPFHGLSWDASTSPTMPRLRTVMQKRVGAGCCSSGRDLVLSRCAPDRQQRSSAEQQPFGGSVVLVEHRRAPKMLRSRGFSTLATTVPHCMKLAPRVFKDCVQAPLIILEADPVSYKTEECTSISDIEPSGPGFSPLGRCQWPRVFESVT